MELFLSFPRVTVSPIASAASTVPVTPVLSRAASPVRGASARGGSPVPGALLEPLDDIWPAPVPIRRQNAGAPVRLRSFAERAAQNASPRISAESLSRLLENIKRARNADVHEALVATNNAWSILDRASAAYGMSVYYANVLDCILDVEFYLREIAGYADAPRPRVSMNTLRRSLKRHLGELRLAYSELRSVATIV